MEVIKKIDNLYDEIANTLKEIGDADVWKVQDISDNAERLVFLLDEAKDLLQDAKDYIGDDE